MIRFLCILAKPFLNLDQLLWERDQERLARERVRNQ